MNVSISSLFVTFLSVIDATYTFFISTADPCFFCFFCLVIQWGLGGKGKPSNNWKTFQNQP